MLNIKSRFFFFPVNVVVKKLRVCLDKNREGFCFEGNEMIMDVISPFLI